MMNDTRNVMARVLGRPRALVGMVHVRPLPGCVGYAARMRPVVEQAVAEAVQLRQAGFDAVMLENMHDRPYLKRSVGPEITAAMTAVAVAVRQAVDCPVGVQILGGANREALAVALAAGCQFVRCEGFVYGQLADEGYMDSQAGELVRYRRAMDAESVLLLADVKKKHASHAISADTDIVEHARTAEFFRADGVIVTGTSTGVEADVQELQAVQRAVGIPVLVGSGLTAENLEYYWSAADAFIVGSWIKRDGVWENPLDAERIEAFCSRALALRG